MTSKYIDNGNYASSGYTLSGAFQSISIGPNGTIGGSGLSGGDNQAYTIVNRGRIDGFAAGITVGDGGLITNASGAAITASGAGGVGIEASRFASLANAGTVMATGSVSCGVYLRGGGIVENSAGGLVDGIYRGVAVAGGRGEILNAGNIVASSLLLPTGVAIDLSVGGSVTNSRGGRITGYYGVLAQSGTAAVTNAGTIIGVGGTIYRTSAVALHGGGSVGNAQGALIDAYVGVRIDGGVGSVDNAGSIKGHLGVILGDGGTVTNSSSAALIQGYAYASVLIVGGRGSVSNAGTIIGNVSLGSGGVVTNQAEAHLGDVLISGASGVVDNGGAAVEISMASGGVLDNIGQVTGAVSFNIGGSVINGRGGSLADGVYGGMGFANVYNAGLIDANSARGAVIELPGGGFVSNATSGVIDGYSGIYVRGHAGTVLNVGTILGALGMPGSPYEQQAVGVDLNSSGSIYNEFGGVIKSSFGIIAVGPSRVFNYGKIKGVASEAVHLKSGGTIVNGASGRIVGPLGIQMSGAGTVVNDGLIAGTAVDSPLAIVLEAASDELILDPGSIIVGAVEGGGGTLALSGSGGVLSGLGTTLGNFHIVSVLAEASWVAGGQLFLDDGAIWRDAGTLAQAAELRLGDASGTGHLSIKPGAFWEIAGDVGIDTLGTGSIGIHGLLEKTAGTGVSAITPDVVNDGTIKAAAATLLLAGAVSGIGIDKIKTTGTLEFTGSVAVGQTIRFTPISGGELILNDPTGTSLSFDGAIEGFAGSDRIDLPSFTFAGPPTVAWSQSGSFGTLTITDGSNVAQLTLFGQYAQNVFGASQDAAGGTVITYAPSAAQVALAASHH